jgi:hypothetical protein
MEDETISVILGDEWDGALRKRLMALLEEMGARAGDHQLGHAGSQDLETLEVTLDGKALRIEAETYIGLTLSGPRSLVEAIQSRLPSTPA